jgi:hypothetical protein
MQAPQYNAPPPDPTVTALNAKAMAADQQATQMTAQIDTASLMARYGTRLAMAGSTSTPAPAPVTTAPQEYPGASGIIPFGAVRTVG